METTSNPRFRHMKAIKQIKAIRHIPQDIVEEILLRLPVKNLSRFKCVSKPWCSVISSKSFIKAHLERSRKSPSLEHHWIIMDYCSHLQKQCSLPSFLQHPPTKFADVKDPPYGTGDVVGVVGSCNGLVCLLTKSAEFILWNPTTRKCMELDSIFNGTRGTYDRIVAHGFGFDESNDEYKIFGVVYRHDDGKYQQKIYGSKMNSWRKIADDANSTMIFGSGKFVSGKLHWAPITYPCMSSDIVTLDLEKEVFGAAEWPRCDKYEHGYSSASVQVIDECLSCLVSYASQSRIDVWILKKKDSWCLLATGTSNPPGKGGWTLAPDRPNLLQPISAGAKYKGGEEKLTRMYSCLYVYHRDDVCFSKPCLVSSHACLKVIKYVESLEMI